MCIISETSKLNCRASVRSSGRVFDNETRNMSLDYSFGNEEHFLHVHVDT